MKTNLKTRNHFAHFTGLLLLLMLFSLPEVQATHLRAGEITAMRDTTANPNPRRYFFKMVTYMNRASAGPSDVTIYTGDGVTTTVPLKSARQINPEINQVVFTWSHTFPADGTYTIGWYGLERSNAILNIAAPANQQNFYISTTINISSFRGLNSTPQFKNVPTFFANIGSKFVHNPGVFDPEGDSLSFKLITPKSSNNTATQVTPVPGYTLPGSLFTCQNSTTTGAATFSMNPVTGQLVWDAPCQQGEYVIAYVVEEWRVSSFGAIKIGEVIHDMQITVRSVQNKPPVLASKDTCITAGTALTAVIRGTDPDGDLINLSAVSNIFPAASFTTRSGNATTGGEALADFSWTPTCADVRDEPYQVIFKAEDTKDPASASLTDVQPWNIRVVAPAPQDLGVTRQGNNLQLN